MAKDEGVVGDEPINQIFHAIRAIIPNIIMRNGVTKVDTEIVEHRDYAYLLGLGLDDLAKRIDLASTLRLCAVDAMFMLGILKTGLAQGGQLINFGDTLIDQGQIYTDIVDLDDFVFDSECKRFRKSAFLGDRNRVPRQFLLDDDTCDHDVVMLLPRSKHADAGHKVEALMQSNMSNQEIFELQDLVDVVEIYVPGAEALIRIPDPEQLITDDYISVNEFYGPDEGPYTFMSLTEEIPGSPFGVPPVGVWYDLHVASNRMMSKTLDQADRQKDVAVVDPSGADEGEDLRTAPDGDFIIGNPDSAKVLSFGGQNQSNERIISTLQHWFNYMSQNPEQLAGGDTGADTATEYAGMQENANIGLEDMRLAGYKVAGQVAMKHAWYLHTDPFIELPVSRRLPGGRYEQLVLTPEQRTGDFLEFTFSIKARSMSRLDPKVKTRRILEFATKLVPSIMQSGMVSMQMGVQFNIPKAITDLADEMGILEEVGDWFEDPEYMNRLQLMMMMGPQPAGKAGAGSMSMGAIKQNGGYTSGYDTRQFGPGGETAQMQQQGAPQPAGMV